MRPEKEQLLSEFFENGRKVIFPEDLLKQLPEEHRKEFRSTEKQKKLAAESRLGFCPDTEFLNLSLQLLKLNCSRESNPAVNHYYQCLHKVITKHRGHDLQLLKQGERQAIETVNNFRCNSDNCLSTENSVSFRRLLEIWVLFAPFIFDYESILRLASAYNQIACLS